MSNAITQWPGHIIKLKEYFAKNFKNDSSTVVTLIGGSHGRSDGKSAFTNSDLKDASLMLGYREVIKQLKTYSKTDEITNWLHLVPMF